MLTSLSPYPNMAIILLTYRDATRFVYLPHLPRWKTWVNFPPVAVSTEEFGGTWWRGVHRQCL